MEKKKRKRKNNAPQFKRMTARVVSSVMIFAFLVLGVVIFARLNSSAGSGDFMMELNRLVPFIAVFSGLGLGLFFFRFKFSLFE